jgi:hypothetical protein
MDGAEAPSAIQIFPVRGGINVDSIFFAVFAKKNVEKRPHFFSQVLSNKCGSLGENMEEFPSPRYQIYISL